jgi:hypothetical protein
MIELSKAASAFFGEEFEWKFSFLLIWAIYFSFKIKTPNLLYSRGSNSTWNLNIQKTILDSTLTISWLHFFIIEQCAYMRADTHSEKRFHVFSPFEWFRFRFSSWLAQMKGNIVKDTRSFCSNLKTLIFFQISIETGYLIFQVLNPTTQRFQLFTSKLEHSFTIVFHKFSNCEVFMCSRLPKDRQK